MSQIVCNREFKAFRRALIISVSAHLALFIFILISPYIPTHSKKGMIHYVNVVSFPGGGGGGGGGAPGPPPGESTQSETLGETALPERESLSDLTVPKALEQQESSLRYPVDKPKREKKTDVEKKSVIQKSTKTLQAKSKSGRSDSGSGTVGGGGSGLRIGVGGGSGSGGIGFGSEYSSQIGMSSFPYTWYLQTLHSRISSNWFTSRIRTGLSGDYFTTISFRIYKDGHISEPEILESSNVKSLDLSAIRAVRSSAPFPPLPTEYKDEYLLIRIIFEHTK